MMSLLEDKFNLSAISLTPLIGEAKELARMDSSLIRKIQYKSILTLVKDKKFFDTADILLIWSTPFLQIFASFLSFHIRRPTISFIYSYPDVISDFCHLSIKEIFSVSLTIGSSFDKISLRNIATSPPFSLPIIFFTSRFPLLKQILVQNNKRRQSFIQLGAPKNKVHVIKMGIDIDLFQPRKSSYVGDTCSQNEETTIAYFGPLSTFRGVDTLLKAYKKVTSDFKNTKLYLIGRSFEPSYLINSMIDNLDLKGEVVVINRFLPVAQLVSLMQNFDIIVSLLKSSVHSIEPPFVVLEAMALEKPVISTPLNGIDEIITQKESGLLVKPNNVEDAVSAMELILSDRKKAQIMGKKAREFIVNQHNIKIFVEELSKLIERAVE